MNKLREYMSDYVIDGKLVAGISFAVLKEGECLAKESYGYANLENQIKIDSKTNFYLASLAKAFTAAAIMMLYERGKLDLDHSIRGYFENLPSWYEDVKVMDLVKHSAGIKDYFACFDMEKEMYDINNNEVYEKIILEEQLEFDSGEKFKYSNSGYVLLSMLIETVSGQSYSEFLKDNIFIPLGMKNTYVFTEDKPTIPKRAYGYKNVGGEYTCNDYFILTTGDGGMYSNIDDLILWSESFDKEILFSNETVEKMFSKSPLNNGELGKYGFGWMVYEKNNKKVIFHAGGLAGFTNLIVKIPEDNFTVIILTNCFEKSWENIFKEVHDFVMDIKKEF